CRRRRASSSPRAKAVAMGAVPASWWVPFTRVTITARQSRSFWISSRRRHSGGSEDFFYAMCDRDASGTWLPAAHGWGELGGQWGSGAECPRTASRLEQTGWDDGDLGAKRRQPRWLSAL